MVQDQLTDYISSQLKLGVSRDAIKTALVSAGWVAADVEDTLKKVMGNSPAVAAAATSIASSAASTTKPITSSPSGMSSLSSNSPSSSPMKSSEPQMIKVSDLVSSSSSSPASMSMPKTNPMGVSSSPMKTFPETKKNTSSMDSFVATDPIPGMKRKGFGVTEIIAVVLVLAFGGAAWYFYSQNSALASRIATLSGQSGSVNAQLSAMQAQLDASTTSLMAQVTSLTSANTDLALNLSFYAAPLGASSTTPLPVTISGSLSGGGRAPYAITTSRGVKVFVSNSTDVQVSSQLKALLGNTVQVTGTYVPGFDDMTVNSVTNLSTPPTATSTATTTKQ